MIIAENMQTMIFLKVPGFGILSWAALKILFAGGKRRAPSKRPTDVVVIVYTPFPLSQPLQLRALHVRIPNFPTQPERNSDLSTLSRNGVQSHLCQALLRGLNRREL